MKRLINFWGKGYYIEPLLILVLIFTLLIALKHRKKCKALRYIHFYIITLLLVFISSNIFHLTKIGHPFERIILDLVPHIDYFFTFFELLIFSHFYYELTHRTIIQKTIIFLNIAFLFFFVSMLASDDSDIGVSANLQAKVYTVEAIILLLICLPYFIRLFKKPNPSALTNDPTFWVSTGLLFFLTCTLPFSFLEPYIRDNHNHLLFLLYPIFYIFYILLLLMIIKAYLCNPEKNKELVNFRKYHT